MQSIQWDGKQISKPGIYRGIPLADYRRADLCDAISVSSSMFRSIITKSPKHAFEKSSLNPARSPEDEDTDAMALGRFVHKAVAGEHSTMIACCARRPWPGTRTMETVRNRAIGPPSGSRPGDTSSRRRERDRSGRRSTLLAWIAEQEKTTRPRDSR
jgi:hypothetical protein